MKKSVMEMVVSHVQGADSMVILQALGELDRFTYPDLINKARELYENGQRFLIVDISEVQEMGLSGLFALYSIAMIFQGEEPLDSEGGAVAMRSMASHLEGLPYCIRLLRPQPHIQRALLTSGLPIYNDLAEAIASF